MAEWLAFAQGPLFRLGLAVMVLGLLRHLVIVAWGISDAYRRTEDKNVSWWRAARRTLEWLMPLRHLGQRRYYTLISVVFHVSAIAAPLFLFAHVRLIDRSLGVSWWTLPSLAADILTVVAVAALLALLIGRVASRAARGLSRVQDYAIPTLIAVPFVTGFFAAHPALNPFATDPTLLVHALSADLLLLSVPFTKLAHMALLPLTQLPSELAWRFPADYPELVVRQIGTEGRPI